MTNKTNMGRGNGSTDEGNTESNAKQDTTKLGNIEIGDEEEGLESGEDRKPEPKKDTEEDPELDRMIEEAKELEEKAKKTEEERKKMEELINKRKEKADKISDPVEGTTDEELEKIKKIEEIKYELKRELTEINERTQVQYKEDFKELKDKIEEKNKVINILSIEIIDLINIDMGLISEEIRKSKFNLNNIATIKQFERLNELENSKGINMAYKVSKLYLEDAGMQAKLAIPSLDLTNILLEKISEKLRYVNEDRDE